jgi:hypothetical protein
MFPKPRSQAPKRNCVCVCGEGAREGGGQLFCKVGTSFHKLREEHRSRVSNYWVLRVIFEPKEEVAGECCIMRSFVTCTLHQMLLGRANQGG